MTGTQKLSLAQLDLKKESDHLAMTFCFIYILKNNQRPIEFLSTF